jgi:drug/metabolite transporter (DMT)-like permease
MLWLIVILSSYFLLAAVHLVDKYLLGERIPSSKVYTFYIQLSGIFVLVLVPFGFLVVLKTADIILALIAGVFHTLAMFVLLTGLKNFEASRIIPAIGAFLPLFTFSFILIYGGGSLAFLDIIIFLLLLLGAFLITWQRKKAISFKALKISALAAFLFALYFILIKFVYLSQPFISGLIWIRVGAALAALCFLFFREVREDLFKGPKIAQKKNWAIVLPNQAVGGVAAVLQNWAIALAPFVYLGIINALEGIKYVFLLIFAILVSLKFPNILKEEISKEVVLQKIIAILFIGAGLALLAF